MAATVAASVVQSRLDYANALLHGALTGNIHKLQCAQNSLSYVVLPHHKGTASSRLSHLHWQADSIENCSYSTVNHFDFVMLLW